MSKSTTGGIQADLRHLSVDNKSHNETGDSESKIASVTNAVHPTSEIMRITRKSNYADQFFSLQR